MSWWLAWLEYVPYNLRPFIPSIIIGVVVLPPLLSLLRRTGKNYWWAILCFIPPIAGIPIALYVVAFGRWPKEIPPQRRS